VDESHPTDWCAKAHPYGLPLKGIKKEDITDFRQESVMSPFSFLASDLLYPIHASDSISLE
jgi:hypothetical protein